MNALRELRVLTYEEFAADRVLRTSAERDFQVAIQAAIDIGSMILAEQTANTPKTYSDIFLQLADVGVIPHDFAQNMVGMTKFRNVLVHMYLDVDVRKVYQYIQHNLEDFDLFARSIGEYLASSDESRTL